MVVTHGHPRGQRGLADPVAVAARAAALRRVDDEVAAAAADEVDHARGLAGLPHLAHALDGEPGGGERGGGPGRGDDAEAELGQRRRRPARAPALSASRTERKAVPAVGSGRPAARSALASAVGKSAALAITSPVERISGPSTGSLPGKRANGSTAALTLTSAGGRSGGRREVGEPLAGGQAAGGVDEVERRSPCSRTAPCARRAGSPPARRRRRRTTASWTLSSPTTPSAPPEAAHDVGDLELRQPRQRGRRQHAGRVAGVDARPPRRAA